MSPDDPRHGRRAGYIAGCRDTCCRVPHVKYQKRATLRRHREGSQYIDATPVLRRLDDWARYGVTPQALAEAANLSEGAFQRILREGGRIEKPTMRGLFGVTWDDLPDSALVNADLTRWRVTSMQAAGHRLEWISENTVGINVGGKWRTQAKVTLKVARSVQKLFDAAPTQGPSKIGATKARNRGYLPRGQWDNPVTPAMPTGWKPTVEQYKRRHEVDEVVVLRLLAGEKLQATPAERSEVIRRWAAMGKSERQICAIHGWREGRYRVGEAA